LVRGLYYYTKTVFEIVEDSDQGKALGALVGGGRYDNLAKVLGRRDIPATGGAAGVERIITSMKETGTTVSRVTPPKIFLSQVGKLAKRKSLKLFEEFRKAKISIIESFGRDSLRAQLAKANKFGVLYTLILGHKEAIDGTIIVRNMKTGKQKTVKMDKVVKEMKKNLKK
jgi:histidyl-tRNA synthetase